MGYKVFLVEDEIVTREGIRDNVAWESAGFEFCGEASDGEIALPLIEETRPDVLITDIKMPFMDGLQLSKIVREKMPWVKVIILSGHDEFEYAQTAVQLGVTEYLLKPISSAELLKSLKRVAERIDKERKEQLNLQDLQERSQKNMDLLEEKFLLRLVVGGISTSDAIEQSKQFGLNIIAQYYQVLLIKINLCNNQVPFDYEEYQNIEDAILKLVDDRSDILHIRKDIEEVVLLLISNQPDQIQRDANELAQKIKIGVELENVCNLTIGIGQPHHRLSDIHVSFLEALDMVKNAENISHRSSTNYNLSTTKLSQLDQAAIETYLKSRSIQDFDDFYASYLQSIGEQALQSDLIKNYLLVDIVLTIIHFIETMGGKVDQVIPEINEIDLLVEEMTTMDQIYEVFKRLFISTLKFRNSQASDERLKLIQESRVYIDANFTNPDLRMNQVAEKFNISPGYFSSIFSQEIGKPFRDYLTDLRINRAKALLRTTNHKSSEIASEIGYNDPHYFSTIFKKNTGVSPQQFRAQTQLNKK